LNEKFDNENDLNNQTGGKKVEIVLFYALWCGYSRQFLPEWKSFVESIKLKNPQIEVKEIKCEEEQEKMCTQMGVTGYPTVILYKTDMDGKKEEVTFLGERTAASLSQFVDEHIQK
jgi:thiol-disulfide isomerase/thioredoxin